MTAWTAVAGSASVWLLVIVLATGAGYAAVLAWARWGGRLPVPDPVGRALAVALGPTGAPAVVERRPAAPAPVETPASSDGEAAEKEGPRRMVHPVGATAGAAVTTDAAQGVAVTEGANDEAGTLVAGGTDEAEDAQEGPPVPGGPDPAAQAAREAQRPRRDLPRADALTELSTVLAIEYDAAAALLEHGLWGFENFDEWSRSMRGRPRPDDVPEEAWGAATHATWRDLEAQVEAHRVKHAALQTLETLWGVGPEEAEALYAAGYKDVAAVRKASTDAIAKVPGIGQAKAFQIRAAAHGLAPTP